MYGIQDTPGNHDDQPVIHCGTEGPEYERVGLDNHNGYDVIDRKLPRPQHVSHAHHTNVPRPLTTGPAHPVDQDYSVLDADAIEHDYHILEDTAGGAPPLSRPLPGEEVQDYEVPLTRGT